MAIKLQDNTTLWLITKTLFFPKHHGLLNMSQNELNVKTLTPLYGNVSVQYI